MPRTRIDDYLQQYRFHLLDLDFGFSSFPPWVLLPSAGFSSITSPEITVEKKDIVEGNYNFGRYVLGKASVNTITLQRGVSTFNSDFFRWLVACIQGRKPDGPLGTGNLVSFFASTLAFRSVMPPAKRRNLLLFHFTGMDLDGLKDSMSDPLDAIKATALLPAALASEGLSQLSAMTKNMIDFGITSIPGKVLVMFNAMPIRYKPASDFDASASEISISELEIAYESLEEFGVMA